MITTKLLNTKRQPWINHEPKKMNLVIKIQQGYFQVHTGRKRIVKKSDAIMRINHDNIVPRRMDFVKQKIVP